MRTILIIFMTLKSTIKTNTHTNTNETTEHEMLWNEIIIT